MDELMELAGKEGIELPDEIVEQAAAGYYGTCINTGRCPYFF